MPNSKDGINDDRATAHLNLTPGDNLYSPSKFSVLGVLKPGLGVLGV